MYACMCQRPCIIGCVRAQLLEHEDQCSAGPALFALENGGRWRWGFAIKAPFELQVVLTHAIDKVPDCWPDVDQSRVIDVQQVRDGGSADRTLAANHSRPAA